MTTIVKSTTSARIMHAVLRPGCAAAVAMLALAACSKSSTGPDEMDWARAALGRNDQLQVVASDLQARTFTVRLKDSGQLRVLPLDQIVAGPQEALVAGTAATASVSSNSGGEAASGSAAPAQAGTTAAPLPPVTSGAPTPSSSPTPAPRAQSATAMASSSGSEVGRQPGNASSSSDTAANANASGGANADGNGNGKAGDYEVVTDPQSGRLLKSGPGYSIQAGGIRGTVAHTTSIVAGSRGAALERLHDPIICQGARLLQIDNRNLEFDGDAVSSESGCEIHITNTRISAKGIGVLARAASVHIENSEIEGDSGSIDASDGAQVYAEQSTFKGVRRSMEEAAFHDLGGNVWN
jgi:hypothetical protein